MDRSAKDLATGILECDAEDFLGGIDECVDGTPAAFWSKGRGTHIRTYVMKTGFCSFELYRCVRYVMIGKKEGGERSGRAYYKARTIFIENTQTPIIQDFKTFTFFKGNVHW